ncbi:hypothetical protein [Frigoribacterium sp. CG_9.8]|uniref:hypothetical protein n=1 Tax=Frigoribacterium sp. CG_9.8 TaxID=2787733 RepID=UPI0018C9DA93|nr:hypothetical protein [Frigoribacterium sp. CG_9.8]MBG6106615.1 hypothetical protein [Frigoribacterium sp. CG_9.8]
MSQNIQTLTVSNFKGIRGEVTLHPSGESLIVLSGANGQGKSSFIDGIRELFDPQGAKETALPMNIDADGNSYAEFTTATARVRRTWKEQGNAGKLQAWERDENGIEKVAATTPTQFILNATGGAIFDAESFINLDDKKQRAALLARVELPFDLDALAAKRAQAYEARRDAKKEVDTLAAQVAGMPPIDVTLPETETPSSEILAALDKVREHNALVQHQGAVAASATAQRQAAHGEVERLAEAFAAAQVAAGAAVAAEKEAAIEAASIEPKDESALVAQLAAADTTNAAIRAQAVRRKADGELTAKREAHALWDGRVASVDKIKADGLAGAKFPIEGLSVDDDGITVGGIPFRQLNDATKAQVAFDLATAAQPDVRLFYMKQGDLLDRQSLTGLAEKAAGRGYTLLMERDRDESRQLFGATFTNGQASINTAVVAA